MIKFFKKFEIKLSLFIVLIFTILFGLVKYFIIGGILVFLHEIAHILTARFFGLKCSKINLTPIGQMAVLENLESLPKLKKIIIVLAGPILNIIFVIICNFFTNDEVQLIKQINLSIAFFNLLPIYPLDGGRIYHYILGDKIGILKSALIVKKTSLILSYIIFLLGFLQMALISYNISLLCLGFYLIKINKNEYLNFTFEFYKYICNKMKLNKNEIFKINEIIVDKSVLNKQIFISLTQEYYTIINICENGSIKWKITEKEFIEKIQLNGLNGKVYDLIQDATID